jgi:queuosine precursor transporter
MTGDRYLSVFRDKRSFLFVVLLGIFLTNAIIAEIIGVKIFSLENSLGIPPMQIPVFKGYILDFNLTAGVLIWPVVFVTTDIINEYYGKEVVKRISYLACFLILYGFLVIWFATKLPPAAFWQEINNKGPNGSTFDINYGYSRVFGQGLQIIIGSVTAFLISQILDAYIFHYIKKNTHQKYFWLRSTGSTLVSQLIDSFVVLYIAFYLLQDELKWPFSQVIAVAMLNYIYKFAVAVILTPVLMGIHKLIDRYLGEDTAEELVEEAVTE